MFIRHKFSRIYRNNLFLGTESRSGEGSGLSQTFTIRKEIPKLIIDLNVRSLIDAPCGDFLWMQEIDLPVEKYIGIDIVQEIIKDNQQKYGNGQRSFQNLNIIEDELPTADMILCRDCLVHLSYSHCKKIITNFRVSGSKYLLTTTFIKRPNNVNLGKGFWRPLNLEKTPFNFPKPILIINENCTEDNGKYSDKSLGLWMLKDITI